jgi:hypothetical protein
MERGHGRLLLSVMLPRGKHGLAEATSLDYRPIDLVDCSNRVVFRVAIECPSRHKSSKKASNPIFQHALSRL